MSEQRNRRAVSIEQLLTWAYRDQMVHQASRGPIVLKRGGGPLAAFSTLWAEAAPIEASRKSGLVAADDAWRVHDLVMGLGRIVVDCGQDLQAARYHGLGQYRGAEPPIGGGNVDQSARPWPTNGTLEIDLRALVMIHATKATRPALVQPDFRMKAGETVWHPTRKTKIYAKGWFCHITADGDLPGDVLQAWQIYTNWRGSLTRLQAAARGIAFTMFSVTAALPPEAKKPS